MNGYTNQYLANTVLSASPEQLLLMLCDGAGRFLAQAIQAIEDGRIEQRTNCINKASAIVAEFAATLDRSQAPALADDLTALYAYMLQRMMQANLKNDAEPLVEVKGLLADLRATWAEAIEINRAEQHQSADAAKSEAVARAAAAVTTLAAPVASAAAAMAAYKPLAVAM